MTTCSSRVFQLRASNQPIFALRVGLSNKDIAKIEQNGPQLAAQVAEFERDFPCPDSVGQGFLQEAKELLDRYRTELPVLKRDDEVKKEIMRLKTHGSEYKLEAALAQKDAAGVLTHGDRFRQELNAFTDQYGNHPLGKQYLENMSRLLTKLDTEGSIISRAYKVKEAISQIRAKGDVLKLNMALNIRDAPKIAEHGEAFRAQFEQFMRDFKDESSAATFISESQELLKRYEHESPSILKQDKMKTAIANFRAESDMMAMHAAVHAQDLAYLKKHGPDFEIKLNRFLVEYNTDPVYSELIPAHFLEQARDIMERYYKLLNIPKAFNPRPTMIISRTDSAGRSPNIQPRQASPPFGGSYVNLPGPTNPTPGMISSTLHQAPRDPKPFPSSPAAIDQPIQTSSLGGYVNSGTARSTLHTSASLLPSTIPTALSSSSGGYVNSSSSYVNTSQHGPRSDWSPSNSGSDFRGYVADSGPASCPINPAYAPSPPTSARTPASAPAPTVSMFGSLSEQEKLSIEETKAQMKFREIKFEELQILKKLGMGTMGTVYLAMWRGTLVAAKKLEEQQMDNDMIELFKQEAAAMHVLAHHPSLASFVGAVWYGSLEAALRGPKRLELTWKQVIKIAMEASAGILHLHKEGVLHRRISSRNILLGDGLRAYVNDFAFSHMKPRDSVYTHTAGTSFIGPVRYMSPDAMMHKYSEGSDAWAFGVLLWELWERKEPFAGDDDMTVAFRVSQDNQTLPVSSSCPLVLATLMKQCWLDRPSQRPTFRSIFETLETYYKQIP